MYILHSKNFPNLGVYFVSFTACKPIDGRIAATSQSWALLRGDIVCDDSARVLGHVSPGKVLSVRRSDLSRESDTLGRLAGFDLAPPG